MTRTTFAPAVALSRAGTSVSNLIKGWGQSLTHPQKQQKLA